MTNREFPFLYRMDGQVTRSEIFELYKRIYANRETEICTTHAVDDFLEHCMQMLEKLYDEPTPNSQSSGWMWYREAYRLAYFDVSGRRFTDAELAEEIEYPSFLNNAPRRVMLWSARFDAANDYQRWKQMRDYMIAEKEKEKANEHHPTSHSEGV